MEEPTDEYRVKAAFIYNFARFIEWPSHTFRNSTDRFAICILGEDPFGRSLKDMIAGKTVDDREFRIVRISDAAQSGGCQILFLGSIESKRVTAILAVLPAAGILTVGESEGFATSGGVINFVLNEGRVRFQINRRAAERAKLQISSRVLSLAQLVGK